MVSGILGAHVERAAAGTNARRRFLVAMGIAILLPCACSQGTVPHPRTKEEFATAFKTAFERGDRETIGRWMLWGDVPESLRPNYLGMFTMFAGENKVVSLKIEDYDAKFVESMVANGEPVKFSTTPVYWYSLETAGKAGFEGGNSSTSLRGALGYHEGKLYFCGPIPDVTAPRNAPPEEDAQRDQRSDPQHGSK